MRKLAEVALVTSDKMRTALETAVGPSPWATSYGAVEKREPEDRDHRSWQSWDGLALISPYSPNRMQANLV